MNTPTLTKLLAERLNELGCGEIPTPVRAQLEDEIATKWADEAPRLVAETATPKRVALAFAAHLGVRRKGTKCLPPGVSGEGSGANRP